MGRRGRKRGGDNSGLDCTTESGTEEELERKTVGSGHVKSGRAYVGMGVKFILKDKKRGGSVTAKGTSRVSTKVRVPGLVVLPVQLCVLSTRPTGLIISSMLCVTVEVVEVSAGLVLVLPTFLNANVTLCLVGSFNMGGLATAAAPLVAVIMGGANLPASIMLRHLYLLLPDLNW